MNKKRFILLAAAVLTAVAASAVAISNASSGSLKFAQSNRGTPVIAASIPASEKQTLAQAGADDSSLSLLATRAGIRFYTGTTPAGDRCLITGLASSASPHFGVLACGQAADEFPSASQPIQDYTAYMVPAGTTTPIVQWAAGFAADSVDHVAFVDANGSTHVVAVKDNVYASRGVGKTPVVRLEAIASNGDTLFTQSLLQRALPTQG